LAATLFAGCGGSGGDTTTVEAPISSPQEAKVTLQGVGGPEDVAIFMAIERGYFQEVGLNVWGGIPVLPGRPVGYVTSDTDDFGIAQEPQVAVGKDKKAPVVAVGSLISQPTAAMIWLSRSRIRTVDDLAGKTIGVPGIPYQEEFLKSALAQAGLARADVTIKRVAYDLVPELLSGRVDAIFGGSANREGVEIEASGAKPVITGVRELGIPDYEELVVITRADRLAEDPKSVRGFMSAVTRGAIAAVEDPKAAVNAVMASELKDPDLSRSTLEAEVEATLPLLSTDGQMDPAKAGALVDWMHQEGMIGVAPPLSEWLSNDYLPPS
jgi:putative hydroxymethylpyrimidine transport system substrate-binding protein